MALRGLLVFSAAMVPSLFVKPPYLSWFFLLLSYYAFQFLILKKENLSLNWGQIVKYEIDSGKKIIGLSLQGLPACNPIVFKSPQFDAIASYFREKLPDRERTSHGINAVEQRYDEQTGKIAKFLDKFLFGRK